MGITLTFAAIAAFTSPQMANIERHVTQGNQYGTSQCPCVLLENPNSKVSLGAPLDLPPKK